MELKDTIKHVTDSLRDNPITKGMIPTLGGVGMSFIDELEAYLRLSGLVIGLLIGCATLYVKIKEIFRDHKK